MIFIEDPNNFGNADDNLPRLSLSLVTRTLDVNMLLLDKKPNRRYVTPQISEMNTDEYQTAQLSRSPQMDGREIACTSARSSGTSGGMGLRAAVSSQEPC